MQLNLISKEGLAFLLVRVFEEASQAAAVFISLRTPLRMSLRIRMPHAAATSTVAPGAGRGIVLRSASTGQTTSASVRR